MGREVVLDLNIKMKAPRHVVAERLTRFQYPVQPVNGARMGRRIIAPRDRGPAFDFTGRLIAAGSPLGYGGLEAGNLNAIAHGRHYGGKRLTNSERDGFCLNA